MRETACYISLGSNLGDREAYIRLALEALSHLPDTRIVKVSSLYETEPVCCEGPWFLNSVAGLTTALPPEELLQRCLKIELQMGRSRTETHPVPRILDLDILLYGEQVLDIPELQIPHPRLHERGFVLVPLAEVAPDCIHPGLKQSVNGLLSSLQASHRVLRVLKVKKRRLDSAPDRSAGHCSEPIRL